jgi:Flp pilus assembly protein TadG
MFARLARLGTKFRRFGRARRGSAAVEFALVVVPFFLLTFGMAEIAMIGFAQTSLDFAISETARQIRTGQAQKGGLSYTQIRDQVCTQVNQFMILSCAGNLYLDIDRFDSFVDADNNSNDPTADGALDDGDTNYAPGAPSDIVVVRAYYRWKVLTPLFEPIFQNMSGGQRILVSTMMFRNEPYQ